MTPKVSVLLICERAEQMTGSGCCGKLEGDNARLAPGLFEHVRLQQQNVGLLHRAVRQLFSKEVDDGLVAIVSIDPRNQLYLSAKLWRDVLRYRPGWREGLRTALQCFSLPAVVVNGRVLGRDGRSVDPDTLCHAIGQALGQVRVAAC
jgi:hypothetical protein